MGRNVLSKSCSNFSVLFLVAVNAVIGFGGVGIVAFGGYMWSNFSKFEELISQDVMIYMICSGIILFILSMVAIVGAMLKMKKFLAVYVFLLLLIVIGEIIVFFVILDYLGILQGASDGADEGVTGTSDDILNSREIIINNFLLRTYQTCCVLDTDICSNVNTDVNSCLSAQKCEDVTSGVCIDDSTISLVDKSVCTALEKVGGGLVGSPPDGCGGGDAAGFLGNVTDILIDQITDIGIGAGIVIGVEFLMIVFTMYLMLGQKVDYNRRMPWDDENAPVAALVPTAVSEAEMRRMSQRARQPLVFGDAGDRRSAGRPQNNRRSAGRAQNNRLSAGRAQNNRLSAGRNQAKSQVDTSTGSHVSASRARGNSFTSSISRQRMQENPDVIEDVL